MGEIAVTPKGEKELRVALNRALLFGKGVLQIVSAGKGRGKNTTHTTFSTKRACPSCGTRLSRARPAAVFL